MKHRGRLHRLRKYIGFPGGILKDSDDLMAKVAQFSGIGMYWNGASLSLHMDVGQNGRPRGPQMLV